MLVYLMIALGGAVGAMSRFALTRWVNGFATSVFPWATFSINLLGSCLMGICFVVVTERIPSLAPLRPLIMVGFLGAFTTFSTFSLEIVSLIHQQAWLSAISYLLLSSLLGVTGAAAGVIIARLV